MQYLSIAKPHFSVIVHMHVVCMHKSSACVQQAAADSMIFQTINAETE